MTMYSEPCANQQRVAFNTRFTGVMIACRLDHEPCCRPLMTLQTEFKRSLLQGCEPTTLIKLRWKDSDKIEFLKSSLNSKVKLNREQDHSEQ